MAMATTKPTTTAIHTPRLLLRAAQESDLDDFHELMKNREAMKYWSCAPHKSIEQTSRYLNEMIESRTNGRLDFVIVLTEAFAPSHESKHVGDATETSRLPNLGPVIGKVGIYSEISSPFGYLLHPSHWRKGYMSEAFAALLPHFWSQGVQNIVADVDPRNAASLKILERWGFIEIGREDRTVEIDGEWFDSVFLELKRPASAKDLKSRGIVRPLEQKHEEYVEVR